MLSRKEHHAWFLTPSDKRDYSSDMEKRFFEAIENPPEPSLRLREMVQKYGNHTSRKDQD
jgi:hypothetical protein